MYWYIFYKVLEKALKWTLKVLEKCLNLTLEKVYEPCNLHWLVDILPY